MGIKLSEIKDPKQRATIMAADAAQKPRGQAGTTVLSRILASVEKETLNQTEKEFFELLKSSGYARVQPHAIRLELADKCTYLPDFYCVMDVMVHTTTGTSKPHHSSRLHIYEVKGRHMWEDGWIKLKIAARMYPEFNFFFAQKKGGQWKVKQVKT